MLFLLTRTIQPVIGHSVNTELDWTRPVAFLPALEVPTPEAVTEVITAFGSEAAFKSRVLDYIAAEVASKSATEADNAARAAAQKAFADIRARLGRP